MFNFKSLIDELEAETAARLGADAYAAHKAQQAEAEAREAAATVFDAVESFNYADGTNSYIRQRSARFVIEPRAQDNPALVVRCLDGITGHESWYAHDLLAVLCGRFGAEKTRFVVCGGTNGRYAELSVDMASFRDWLRSQLAQA